MFYNDFIEAGSLRKVPFVIKTKDHWEMFRKSTCNLLSVRMIQREVTFQKGPVNIVSLQNSLAVPNTNKSDGRFPAGGNDKKCEVVGRLGTYRYELATCKS